MGRILLVIAVVALGAGGWYLTANYQLEIDRGVDGGIRSIRLVARVRSEPKSPDPTNLPPAAPARPTMRIATFNLDGLDEAKLADTTVADTLVRILPRFDVVALQGIRSANRGVLVRLIDQINVTGRSYDFARCPTMDRDPVEPYCAFLFDLTSVEVDRSTVHTIEDPQRKFQIKPLVGAFRVRGVPEKEAFTFTLVNVAVDPTRAAEELNLLADVYRAVRDSGRGEDDIILLGTLEAGPDQLGRLGQIPYLTAAVTSVMTTTRGTRLIDNLLMDRRCGEYTGKSGVLDMIRELDLPPQAAVTVSEHMPTWAEFWTHEGGQAGASRE